jgi:hypothetical protein
MKKVLLILVFLLTPLQAFPGKLYKWIGEDGTVNYTQTPPPPETTPQGNAKEMIISSTVIKPVLKHGQYYCGNDKLPKLSDSDAVNISNLQYKIYDWEDALERRKTERGESLRRSSYSAKRLNEVLRRFNNDDLEDRCKIAWARDKLASLQDEKEKIYTRYDTIKTAVDEVERRKLIECGKDDRTGFIEVDEQYREYMKCNKRFDRQLKELKRKLKKAENNRDLVDIE